MVDEEPLCGPCGTSKSWVWVSEILLYLFICLFTLTFLLQIMSIEDVERIMDETQEGIEYQRVCIIISMQENNHVLQGADTADELQQDLCKNHLVSHPIFFIYCQKLKVTCISVQTVSYIKTGKYFNSREKRRKTWRQSLQRDNDNNHKKVDCLLVLPPPSTYLSLALPVAVYIKLFLWGALLEEARLLISKAICFSLSMECIINWA